MANLDRKNDLSTLECWGFGLFFVIGFIASLVYLIGRNRRKAFQAAASAFMVLLVSIPLALLIDALSHSRGGESVVDIVGILALLGIVLWPIGVGVILREMNWPARVRDEVIMHVPPSAPPPRDWPQTQIDAAKTTPGADVLAQRWGQKAPIQQPDARAGSVPPVLPPPSPAPPPVIPTTSRNGFAPPDFAADVMPGKVFVLSPEKAKRLTGIRGWLWVFIFVLFLRSILVIGEGFGLLENTKGNGLIFLAGLLDLFLSIYGFIVIFLLMRKKPTAPGHAKTLMVLAGINLVIIFFGLWDAFGMLAFQLFVNAGGAVIWFLYLNLSRRVALTYGLAQAVENPDEQPHVVVPSVGPQRAPGQSPEVAASFSPESAQAEREVLREQPKDGVGATPRFVPPTPPRSLDTKTLVKEWAAISDVPSAPQAIIPPPRQSTSPVFPPVPLAQLDRENPEYSVEKSSQHDAGGETQVLPPAVFNDAPKHVVKDVITSTAPPSTESGQGTRLPDAPPSQVITHPLESEQNPAVSIARPIHSSPSGKPIVPPQPPVVPPLRIPPSTTPQGTVIELPLPPPTTPSPIASEARHVATTTPNSPWVGLPEPGFVVTGRYRVIRLLHRDLISSVHLGKDEKRDKPVWMRLFLRTTATARTAYSRSLVTLRLDANRVDRPIEVGEDGRWFYFIMNAENKATLRQLLHARGGGQPMAAKSALDIALGLCDAIMHVHSTGLIHRRVAPENVVVGLCDERVMLTGFEYSTADPRTPLDGIDETAWPYMAPETRSGIGNMSSDLFSLSAVIYETFTLRPPDSAVQGFQPNNFEAPSALNPSVSLSLSSVIMRGLDPDMTKRWPNAQELRTALAAERSKLHSR